MSQSPFRLAQGDSESNRMGRKIVMKAYSVAAITVVLAFFIPSLAFSQEPQKGPLLSSHEISLANRHPVKSVSEVFKDNILLTAFYLKNGKSAVTRRPDWNTVEQPFNYSFILSPGEVFAFHDSLLAEFKNRTVVTTNSHFNATDGFKSDGYLFGDGVCHLASLIYWVANDAGLEATSLVDHDFAKITGISKEYGVSIYYHPKFQNSSARQNLYITNNRQKPLSLNFTYQNGTLTFSILELDQ